MRTFASAAGAVIWQEDKLQGLLLSQLITETVPFLHQSLLIIWQACLVLAVMELDISNLSGVSSQQA